MATDVEKVNRTCAHCAYTYPVRRYQKVFVCPKCKRRADARTGDRHTGEGIFVRLTEAQKDQIERLAHESGRTQADLIREAVDLLLVAATLREGTDAD